ncbi:PhzF family phenazine biosynthesis protein [Magnetovibrio sp.]|uniref:PhzF family phenazine biosynthesis protein n=1 Tax=Magnetovibrio sp. TaxID=2024836 RepID=UPI002F93ECCD
MSNTIPLYQIDSFTADLFAGNPAAVCPTDAWLSDEVMQKLAAENNLSETAYVVPDTTGVADYGLRWFTPETEVDLCGHATLATAWVLFNELGVDVETLRFTTKSGVLTVARGEGDLLVMDFPLNAPRPAPHHEFLPQALGGPAQQFWTASNGMSLAVLASAEAVRSLTPHLGAVAKLGKKGLIVTAAGDERDTVDFVSRYFAPYAGIAEDPVTGSAHTVLAPYWAKVLKKDSLHARQVSKRGGDVYCQMQGDRVLLSGHATLYMKGEAHVPG